MKKIFTLIALLVSVFAVSTLKSVNNKVDAANLSAGYYVYFEKPAAWNKNVVAFMIGHDTYSISYKMTQISGTDIYYWKTDKWDGYTQYGFMNVDSAWGGEGNGSSSAPVNRIQWAPFKTNVAYASGLPLNKTYNLFGGSDTDPYGATKTQSGTLGDLNVPVIVSAETGGTASASGYKLSSATAVTTNSGSSISALKFTDVTLTATPKANYKFVGWYDGSILISSNATYTVKDVTSAKTYTAKFESTIHTGLNELISTYYNKGVYTKDTVINLTDAAMNELATKYTNKGFHASVTELSRTTYYNGGALWMSREDGKYSYYGTSGKDMTNGVVATVGETSDRVVVKGKTMEEYYTTLVDIVATSAHAWTYANGVYTTTSEEVLKWFKAFTAPCYLGFDDVTANYITFTSATIQETTDGLVLQLHASANTGALVGGTTVFSQATITKGN